MSAAVETLKAARAVIDIPERWTQGVMRVEDARCASGALIAVGAELISGEAYGFLRRATGARRICHWNDEKGRTHAEVMAAFDRAIELAEKAA
jgi:hypothetical protein